MALGKIPQEILDEITARIDIVSVISEQVQLKKTGKDYKGLCPFHDEKSPSFMVSPDKSIFHCFGCGVGGNVFRFLMLFEKLSFPEAVKKLAHQAGVTLEQLSDPKEVQMYKDRELLYKINRYASWFYSEQLARRENNLALKHLQERSITEDSVRTFHLGYAPPEWDSLVRFFESKNIPLEKAFLLGLIRKNKTGNYYDFFRNRLVFPIMDAEDRVIGFSARKLDEADPAGKYINSPETPIYHKGEAVYGLSQAKESLRKANKVVIVEGNIDLVRLHQEGVKYAVAPLGTSLTPLQVKLMRRYADEFYLMLDGDDAGYKASLRALDIFLKEGILPYYVSLPKGEDPDTYVKKSGIEGLQSIIKESKPFVEWLLENELSKSGLRTDQRAEAASKIKAFIDILPDGLLKKAYLTRIEQFMGVEVSDRWQAPVEANTNFNGGRVFAKEKKSIKPKNSLERILLQFYLRFPNLVSQLVTAEIFENFENSDFRDLGLKLVSLYETSGQIVSIHVSETTEYFEKLISELQMEPLFIKEEDVVALVRDTLKNLKVMRIKQELKDLTRQIHVAELNKNTEQMSQLMKKKTDLMSSVKSFSTGE